MFHRIRDWLDSLPTWQMVTGSVTIFLVTFVGSLAVTGYLIVNLPADHFRGNGRPDPWSRQHPVLRIFLKVAKNVLGALLVSLGVIMSLPGVPGQGILTILLGVMMLDVPGRRRFEMWLVRRQWVRSAIDRLRRRYGKPPLDLDEPISNPDGHTTDPTLKAP